MLGRSVIATLALAAALHAPTAIAQTTPKGASACLNQATRLHQQLETRITGPVERRDAIRLLWRARDHAEGGDVGACEQAIAEARERLAGAGPGPGRAARQGSSASAETSPDAGSDPARGMTSGITGGTSDSAAAASGADDPRQAVGSLVQSAGLTNIGGADVVNEAGQRLGDVTRVVQSRDGVETLLVVGVGGFLGLGDREVALPLSAFNAGSGALVLPGYDRPALDQRPSYDSARYTELDTREILRRKPGPQ